MERIRTIEKTLLEYEPYEDIQSAEDLNKFHGEISIWKHLKGNGINPIAFSILFTALLIIPGAVLEFIYEVNHPLTTTPMLAVLAANTLLILFLLFFADLRMATALDQIRDAFDVDDETYYGFVGRMLERLYHLSFFSPVAPGPHGRKHGSLFWFILLTMYVFWAVVIGVIAPVDFPEGTIGQVLAVLYYVFVVGWSTITLFTAIMAAVIAILYLSIYFGRFSVRINFMRVRDRFGLEPWGKFVLRMSLGGFVIILAAGITGLITNNGLMFLFAALGTPLILLFFICSQYGIHRAIVRTKNRRLQKINQKHSTELEIDRIFVESTPEPNIDSIGQCESVIQVKNELEALPNWPVNTQALYQLLFAVIISNLPSVLSMMWPF